MTSYQYDAANQLNSAQQGATVTQYTYDENGSLVSDGATDYTYDPANRLGAVSREQGVESSYSYNGLGDRISQTVNGVTTQYVMDGDHPLSADAAGDTTFYLYGLGPIAEHNGAWTYSLPDGTNTPRQLTDASGEVTLAVRYDPWGDTLETRWVEPVETYGTGNFQFGYPSIELRAGFGGLMDAATGLLYIGNGQYNFQILNL